MCSPLGSQRRLARSHVQKNLLFGTWLSQGAALTIRGEKLANILLLACCYQEVSMGRRAAPFRDSGPGAHRTAGPSLLALDRWRAARPGPVRGP